ncbi:MAG: hydrogenase maturation protease [Terriglobales bacterium]
MLIIGYGNLDRSDDGAGILVAERLYELGVRACSYTGEPLGLIDVWQHADHAILVDAVVTGAPAGTIHVWDGRGHALDSKTPASTHGLGIAEAVELARLLNRLPSRLEVYGIEGYCFDCGNSVSPEVQRSIDEVIRRILTSIA